MRIYIALLVLCSGTCWSQQQPSSVGQLQELKGHVVIDAGDTNKIATLGRISEPLVWYRLNGRCYRGDYPGTWDKRPKQSILLIDRNKVLKLAIIEPSSVSTDVKVFTVKELPCPT